MGVSRATMTTTIATKASFTTTIIRTGRTWITNDMKKIIFAVTALLFCSGLWFFAQTPPTPMFPVPVESEVVKLSTADFNTFLAWKAAQSGQLLQQARTAVVVAAQASTDLASLNAALALLVATNAP